MAKICAIYKSFWWKTNSDKHSVYTQNKKDSIRYSTRVIQEICDYASKQNIIVALTVKTGENQLVSSWSDIRKYFTKVDRENLMLNLDTKFIEETKPDIRTLSPFSESIAQFHIYDYSFDLYKDNTNEITIDLKKWTEKISHIVKDSIKEYGDAPASILFLGKADSKEVQYSLDYLAAILPQLQL